MVAQWASITEFILSFCCDVFLFLGQCNGDEHSRQSGRLGLVLSIRHGIHPNSRAEFLFIVMKISE